MRALVSTLRATNLPGRPLLSATGQVRSAVLTAQRQASFTDLATDRSAPSLRDGSIVVLSARRAARYPALPPATGRAGLFLTVATDQAYPCPTMPVRRAMPSCSMSSRLDATCELARPRSSPRDESTLPEPSRRAWPFSPGGVLLNPTRLVYSTQPPFARRVGSCRFESVRCDKPILAWRDANSTRRTWPIRPHLQQRDSLDAFRPFQTDATSQRTLRDVFLVRRAQPRLFDPIAAAVTRLASRCLTDATNPTQFCQHDQLAHRVSIRARATSPARMRQPGATSLLVSIHTARARRPNLRRATTTCRAPPISFTSTRRAVSSFA